MVTKKNRKKSNDPNQESDALRQRLRIAFENAHPEHRAALVLLVEEYVQKNANRPPSLPKPYSGYQTYDEWKVINKNRDPIACLKQNWGKWLKAFNPALDRDYMSQADLGRLDKKLMTRLRNLYKAHEINEFIPSLSNFHKQLAAQITPDERKETYKKVQLIARHQNKEPLKTTTSDEPFKPENS